MPMNPPPPWKSWLAASLQSEELADEARREIEKQRQREHRQLIIACLRDGERTEPTKLKVLIGREVMCNEAGRRDLRSKPATADMTAAQQPAPAAPAQNGKKEPYEVRRAKTLHAWLVAHEYRCYLKNGKLFVGPDVRLSKTIRSAVIQNRAELRKLITAEGAKP